MNFSPAKNQFSAEDSQHLVHAQAYIFLKMYSEAESELLEMSPSLRQHPEFLESWWQILFQKKLWKDSAIVAKQIIEQDPDNAMAYIELACALERIHGVASAYNSLRPAADRITDSLTIYFNLACYACELGRIDEARTWLTKIFSEAVDTEFEGFYERLAINDIQLKPLWGEISQKSKISPPIYLNERR